MNDWSQLHLCTASHVQVTGHIDVQVTGHIDVQVTGHIDVQVIGHSYDTQIQVTIIVTQLYPRCSGHTAIPMHIRSMHTVKTKVCMMHYSVHIMRQMLLKIMHELKNLQ